MGLGSQPLYCRDGLITVQSLAGQLLMNYYVQGWRRAYEGTNVSTITWKEEQPAEQVESGLDLRKIHAELELTARHQSPTLQSFQRRLLLFG